MITTAKLLHAEPLSNRPSTLYVEDNRSNASEMFRSAMADAGIITDDPIIPDGLLHRIHIEGHSRGSRNGCYILHVDIRVNGWFKDFKAGFESTWSPKGSRYLLTKAEREAIQVESVLRRAERDRQYKEAAMLAQDRYDRALQAHQHPYLEAKRISSCNGLRLSSGEELLVPAVDLDGQLWSLQRIFRGADGRFVKLFLKGTKTSGMSFRIAGNEIIGICEGIATGISLRRETGHSIYVAFGAGNLMAVAQGLRSQYPSARIIVYADNDLEKEINTGVVKGRETAKAIFAELCVPPINGDFNDYLDGGNGH